MKSKKKSRPQYYKSWLIFIVVLVVVYVFLPQLPSFESSLHIIRRADLTYIAAAVLIYSVTYFASAACLYALAYFKLRYWPTFLVQLADGFTNRLAPAGIGSIATNTLYMMKQSKSGIKAGYVSVLNNLVGFAAHLLLLGLLLIVSQQSIHDLIHWPQFGFKRILVLLLVILVVLFGLFWKQFKRASAKNYRQVVSAMAVSFQHPLRLLSGLGFAMIITILCALTLFSVMQALNVHLTFLQTFLVFTVSVFVSVITPTPGGLGGVEASLVATLMAFGIMPGPALSVALVYRLITYWLPILPGILALDLAVKKRYIPRPAKT